MAHDCVSPHLHQSTSLLEHIVTQISLNNVAIPFVAQGLFGKSMVNPVNGKAIAERRAAPVHRDLSSNDGNQLQTRGIGRNHTTLGNEEGPLGSAISKAFLARDESGRR